MMMFFVEKMLYQKNELSLFRVITRKRILMPQNLTKKDH